MDSCKDTTLILTQEELKELALKRIMELNREILSAEREKKALCSAISDPEVNKKIVALATKVSNNIMESNLTLDNISSEPYKNLSEDEQQFFSEKKYKPVFGLHEKVMGDPVVNEGVVALKEEGLIDLRKQRHKKKAGEYVTSLATFKMISDIAKRQQESEERLTRLELAQIENESKFSQIGNALLTFESKLQLLMKLGLAPKKLEAWRIHKENPSLTRQDIADRLGKSKPTVIKWIKEVEDELSKSLLGKVF